MVCHIRCRRCFFGPRADWGEGSGRGGSARTVDGSPIAIRESGAAGIGWAIGAGYGLPLGPGDALAVLVSFEMLFFSVQHTDSGSEQDFALVLQVEWRTNLF